MPPQPAANAAPDSFFEIVFSGGPIGIAIMLALIALSMTALYLIVEQSLALRRALVLPESLAEQVRQLMLAGRVIEARQACHEQPSLLGHVLHRGLGELDGGWPAVEEALEEALAEHAARLFRRVEYLSVLANLAPMLGLLGTVVGIMGSFSFIGTDQLAVAKVSGGVGEALIATAGGLGIAILCLLPHNYFHRRQQSLRHDLEQAVNQAEIALRAAAAAGRPVADFQPAPETGRRA